MVIDGNTIFATFDNTNLIPSSACPAPFPASILFTDQNYNDNGQADIQFTGGLYTQWHDIVIDSPGGNNNGEGTSFAQQGYWWSEDHGSCGTTGGLISIDGGAANVPPGASSTAGRLSGALISNEQNADASEKNLLTVTGSQTVSATLYLKGTDQFHTIPFCLNGSTTCGTGAVAFNLFSDTPSLAASGNNPGYSPTGTSTAYMMNFPLALNGTSGAFGHSPPYPAWGDTLPAPTSWYSTGTGSGGLSAGTYCTVLVGVDEQSSHGTGQTLASAEDCTAVAASGDITYHIGLPTYSGLYKDFYLYYGTSGPGSETHYIDTSIAPSGALSAYTFTSTSGASAGTPPTFPSAYLSWLDREGYPSCLLCVAQASSQAGWQLGVGDPAPPTGAKMSVKGGYLNLSGTGLAANLQTKSSAYTLTTNDFWVNVTGTTTITVPHAQVGHPWTVFNSGSNTVTIQADSGNINGSASITLSANTGKEIACDGTNCFAH